MNCERNFCDAKPPLQHGENFSKNLEQVIHIQNYWVSEKLDGVRGYWNGKTLLSRQGYKISAPLWFTDSLGKIALDGELWIDRNSFDDVSSVIRQNDSDHPSWREIKFMIFDLPGHTGNFDERLQVLENYIDLLNVSWVRVIPQYKFETMQMMHHYHNEIIALGGEGLMLHKDGANV